MGLFPSRPVPDGEYFLTRSITEATLAANARTAQAAAAHQAIARCYLAKLFGERDAVAIDIAVSHLPDLAAKRPATQPGEFRFADLRSVPEDEELNRILASLA